MNKRLDLLVEEFINCAIIYDSMDKDYDSDIKLGLEVKLVRLYDRLDKNQYQIPSKYYQIYQTCRDRIEKRRKDGHKA